MSRRDFIESNGASCKNWRWSWSFVNNTDEFVIFGAWDTHTEGETSLILSDQWKCNLNGNKRPAFSESREHIRLVEMEGYQLFTFPIEYSDAKHGDAGDGPATIRSYTAKLSPKVLRRVHNKWYASDSLTGVSLAEEVDAPKTYPEGASVRVSINAYERNANARTACLAHHGCQCAVCSFDFKEIYGSIGDGYIHVHHIVSLAEIAGEYEVDPHKDLVPVCPNCHAMIHRTKPSLTIEQLRSHMLEE